MQALLGLLLLTLASFPPDVHSAPRAACGDELTNCTAVLAESPSYCKDMGPTSQCHFTCGVCPESLPCAYHAPIPNVGIYGPAGAEGSTMHRGRHLEYYCLGPMYQMVSGNNIRVCMGDGTLSGSPPVCQESLPCTYHAPIPNVGIYGPAGPEGSPMYPGRHLEYYCLGPMYKMVSGDKDRVCMGDGTLSGSPPVCQEVVPEITCKDELPNCAALVADSSTYCRDSGPGGQCPGSCGFCPV